MSSVLHPVGPEPRERYWVRRLAVLVAAVVAIGIVIALVGNAMSAGSAVQAEPAPPSVQAPTLPPPTAVPSASPTPGASATPGATPGAGTSASPTPGTTAPATPTASSTPSSTADADAQKKAAEKKAAEKKAADKKGSGKKKVTVQPTYAACDADVLRPTLTGDRTVKAGKKTTLSLSLINGGKKTCTAKVSASAATLTVVSGSDRIWSTKDCPKAMPATKRTLLPEHALAWKVTWDGSRSGDGCSAGKVKPKKGYYWAIASVDGADDVRFRIILR